MVATIDYVRLNANLLCEMHATRERFWLYIDTRDMLSVLILASWLGIGIDRCRHRAAPS